MFNPAISINRMRVKRFRQIRHYFDIRQRETNSIFLETGRAADSTERAKGPLLHGWQHTNKQTPHLAGGANGVRICPLCTKLQPLPTLWIKNGNINCPWSSQQIAQYNKCLYFIVARSWCLKPLSGECNLYFRLWGCNDVSENCD